MIMAIILIIPQIFKLLKFDSGFTLHSTIPLPVSGVHILAQSMKRSQVRHEAI